MGNTTKTADVLAEISRLLPLTVAALPALEIPELDLKQGKGDEEEVVLVISDLQIGHTTPTTDAKIVQARLQRLARRFVKIVGVHRKAYPIKKLHVFLLGDIVHGESVGHTVGLDELEHVLMDQMFKIACPALEKLLVALLPHFPDGIDVWTASGNHGRLDKFHADSTNMDTIVYRFLEARLANQKGIRWHIADQQFYQMVEICNHKFLVFHGDAIPMYLTLPYYGLTTRAMRLQGAVGNFDYMVTGHFHVASSLCWNAMEIFVNGCFVTDDQWVLKKLGMSSTAKQIAFGVHPNQGVSWRYHIKLD